MSEQNIDRRSALQLLGAAGGIAAFPGQIAQAVSVNKKSNFLFSLNTATIREHKLGLEKELEVSAKAGFSGVELWIDTLDAYMAGGGTAQSLRSLINGLGLRIDDAIGFEQWIAEDDSVRSKALENLRRQMDILASIGCTRIAAPPAGATEGPVLDLKKVAERYRAILEIGKKAGVVPQLELWGFSVNLSRLSEVIYVAVESGHPDAKVLLDNYHLYKGGSEIGSLHLLDPSATDILHVNDYPEINRATIKDSDRIMPGDGVSPLKKVLQIMRDVSRPLILSVEIFNKTYYQQDAAKVAKLAFDKIRVAADSI